MTCLTFHHFFTHAFQSRRQRSLNRRAISSILFGLIMRCSPARNDFAAARLNDYQSEIGMFTDTFQNGNGSPNRSKFFDSQRR